LSCHPIFNVIELSWHLFDAFVDDALLDFIPKPFLDLKPRLLKLLAG
jgi:hypothetical protein